MSDVQLARPEKRRGMVLPAILTVLGVGVLIGLGIWQLERKAWKEELIARLTERLSDAPANLPPRESWSRLRADDREFRRVTFPGEFLHDQEALVYAPGSAFRPDASGVGYWVFTPARLPGGSLVVVNRGFVPEGRQEARARPQGQLPGVLDITGAMRWPERRGQFTPADNPQRNLWFVRDPVAIAQAKGWGTVAPFYIEQEAPPAPGGLPRAGKLQVNLANNHLQYALTWFGLAAALSVVFILWAIKQRRQRSQFALDNEHAAPSRDPG